MGTRATFIVRGSHDDLFAIEMKLLEALWPCMCTQSNRDRGLLSGWGEVKDGRLLDALVNVCDPYDVELVVVGESRDDDYGITYPRKPA